MGSVNREGVLDLRVLVAGSGGGDYIAPGDALRWVPMPKENSDVK